MNADELFNDFRRRGLRANEAAAVIGYTVLVPLVGWDGLNISPRRRRKIQRTLKRLNIDIQDFRDEQDLRDEAAASGGIPHKEGVIVSGRI